MQKKTAKVRVKLDWSRLLGFDQAPAPDCASDGARSRAQLANLGAKLGGKPGVKN